MTCFVIIFLVVVVVVVDFCITLQNAKQWNAMKSPCTLDNKSIRTSKNCKSDDNYNCVQRKLQTISENWLYTTVKYPARVESNQRRLQIVYTSPSNECRVYQPIASVTRTEVFLFVRLLIFCNLCLHAHFSSFPALQLN